MKIVPYINMDSSVCARLDVSDLNIPNVENLQHLLLFPIGTYTKLTAIKHSHKPTQPGDDEIKSDVWDMTYAAINQFINTLPKNQQVILAQGFMLIHNTIQEFFKANTDLLNLNATLRNVGEQLDAVDAEIDLCGQLRTYIDNNMVVGLYEGAGKRAQDSDVLTFFPEQVKDLMTITLLCKMLSPIYGSIMNAVEKRIDTKLKEILCVTILTKLFERRYKALIEKLQHYIKHTVEQNNEESASGLMHGYDNNSLAHHMYSALMARQFVNVDLRVRNGNLMTYIIVSIKRAIATVRSAIKKNPTFSRKPVASKHEEDGNTAQLEIDSMTSRKTLDGGPIIVAAVDPAIKSLMNKFQIDEESYIASLRFYERNPIIPNQINQDVNSILFSRLLGGGDGLKMLHSPEYTKLSTIAQLIAFSSDINYRELGHMITARLADSAIDTTINPSMFKVKVGSSQSYRTVKQLFENNPFGFKGKDWDNHVQRITENLTTNKYLYNTSNFLWDWLGEDNLNGKIFAPSDATITALCSLYEYVMQIENL